MTARDVMFQVGGERIAAWHYTGAGDDFADEAGRPCVVMAHGVGATRDSGLEGFAEQLAAGGLDVLAFDYRHFGASGGQPRQVVSLARQRQDYHAAIGFARTLHGVDPRNIVLWGCSLAGGHVLQIGAEDPAIAAVIALTPAPDGLAALRGIMRRDGLLHATRLGALGVRDAVAAARGRPPVTARLAAAPGQPAALTAPGALEAYTAIAGPTWRNEIAARIFLQVGTYRPIRKAAKLRCPVLVQIADNDGTAPPLAAMKAAESARAEVRHYPCDHFDIYPGRRWFGSACKHQLEFLRRRLSQRSQAGQRRTLSAA